MSIKKLFDEENRQKVVSNKTATTQATDVESQRYVEAELAKKEYHRPRVHFGAASASNFAIYGSAKKYYEDSISYIQEQYPYDGAYSEKIQWELSASQLDLHFFDKLYPRTNGYANLCSTTSGWGSLNGSITSNYGLPADIEYIQLKGGPHTGSGTTLVEQFYTHKQGVGSNIYKTDSDMSSSSGGLSSPGSRESNLKTDLEEGITVEFWLKKPAVDASKTVKEVIFDMWNGHAISNANYGRLLIELNCTASGSPFRVTLKSGSFGFADCLIGKTSTLSTIQTWNHYAFTFKKPSGTGTIRTRMYINGVSEWEDNLGTWGNLTEITGSLIANLGALRTSPVSGVTLTEGAGKLSGSIDEFRFWKTARDHKEIGRYWWTQFGGGSNTDIANTTLGVYYKFNEGITGYSTVDNTVLDYSGRITNGYWVGYPGITARSTESAIVEASAANSEFKDPIIRSQHPDVALLKQQMEISGSLWDDNNNSMLYHSLPAWIVEKQENEKERTLHNVVHTVATYFDHLHMQIADMKTIKAVAYPSASLPQLPFADKLLGHAGFDAGELFANADVLSKISSRSNTQEFELELQDIKNTIYQNIYNNLSNIYKTKGTESSFRNLIRCFGVDDDLIKLNLYADNVTYKLEDTFKTTTKIRRYANFSTPNTFKASVYQRSESGNTNSTSYISGSKQYGKETKTGAAIEAEVFFPKRLTRKNPKYFNVPFDDISIFGTHTVGSDDTSYAFPSPDPASLHVIAVKHENESPHVYFKLTSSVTSGIPVLTSSLFYDVYDNEKWNLSVRIRPPKYPVADLVNIAGSVPAAASATDAVDLAGYQAAADPSTKFTIAVPAAAGGSGTTITIKFDISSTSSPTSAGSNHITIGTAGSDDASNAALVIKAINGTTDSRITYGNSSGDGSSGIGIQGITASAGSSSTKVTLTMSTAGIAGNVSGVVTHAAGTVDLIDVSDFTGGLDGDPFLLEFHGVNTTLGTIENEFYLTASVPHVSASNYLTSSKRVFIGADKQDFEGTVLMKSDVQISAARYWGAYSDGESFKARSKDLDSYGTLHPSRNINTILSNQALSEGSFGADAFALPESKTLLLNWDFETLTESDSSGEFVVPDASSGSAGSSEYGWFGVLANRQHTGKGHNWPASSAHSITKRPMPTAKLSLPESIYSSDMISIRDRDDDLFTREHRPARFYFAIEKSMYQSISEEMLKMFATIVDFNNLIGEPVNRYRQEYKGLEKLRQMFFDRVQNTPDLDKYVEYYKWIDSSINDMLLSLVPASADSSEGISTMVESHVLERNKYWNKFPTLEMKADPPEAGLFGIQEQLYNWKEGHRPVGDSSSNQDTASEWWDERAERTDAATSGVAVIDSDRQEIKNVIGKHRDGYRKVATSSGTTYSGSAYAVSRFTKPYRLNLNKVPEIHGGHNYREEKDLDVVRVNTAPHGPEGPAGHSVNAILYDEIYHSPSDLSLYPPAPETFESSRAVRGRQHNRTHFVGELGNVWPHSKTRYSFKAHLLRDFGAARWDGEYSGAPYHGVMKGDLAAPFSLYYTSISNTFQKYIGERFYENLAITNLHVDTYGSNSETPMQGPFTNTFVGGRQHRHVLLNKIKGRKTKLDTFDSRKEAWKLLLGPTLAASTPLTGSPWFVDPYHMGVVGPDYPWPPPGGPRGPAALRPRAIYLRDEVAKRPLNIRNIKFSFRSSIIGNYSHEYEIVQAHGRNSNNRALTYLGNLKFPASSSAYMADTAEYIKLYRAKSKHIFTSRFSAPGDPIQAADSEGGLGLDQEAAVFSPYNTLNYRNLLIRGAGRWPNGVRELLVNHTNQFGYFSDQMNVSNGAAAANIFTANVNTLDYTGRLNFHRTNRNTGKRLDPYDPTCIQESGEWNKKSVYFQKDDDVTCEFPAYATVYIPDEISEGAAHASYGITRARPALPNGHSLQDHYGAWGVSMWLWPNARSSSNPNESSCKRGVFSLGSATCGEGPPSRSLVGDAEIPGSLMHILRTAQGSRRIYLDENNKVVYECDYVAYVTPPLWPETFESRADGNQYTYTCNCAKWRTSNAITEAQWSNLIVEHEAAAIDGSTVAAEGAMFGDANGDGVVDFTDLYMYKYKAPNIYVDGVKQTLVEVTAPNNFYESGPWTLLNGTTFRTPVAYYPAPCRFQSYIGRADPCGSNIDIGDMDGYLGFYGRIDEVTLWRPEEETLLSLFFTRAPGVPNFGGRPVISPTVADLIANGIPSARPAPGNPMDIHKHSSLPVIDGQIVNWWRFGDGHATPGPFPASGDNSMRDAVNSTSVPSRSNIIYDMASREDIGGPNHAFPNSFVSGFTDVSPDQSTTALRLPGPNWTNEYCVFGTGSQYDNWYITHEIPRSEAQYTWVSQSCYRDSFGTPLDGNGHAAWWHTTISGLVPRLGYSAESPTGSAYVEAIQFISSSNYGSYVNTGTNRIWGTSSAGTTSQFIPTDFVGLNTNIAEPLTASTNILGYPGTTAVNADGSPALVSRPNILEYLNDDLVGSGAGSQADRAGYRTEATLLNAIILNRQGPYGWPSWKQIRGSEHPATRNERKRSALSVAGFKPEHSYTITLDNGKLRTRRVRGLPRADTFSTYFEPPIVYNCPMVHIVNNRTVLKHSYRNNTCMYSNQEINNLLGLGQGAETAYDALVNQYTAATHNRTLFFNYLSYCEGIYPKEINRYRNTVRTRENFDFSWSTIRSERSPKFTVSTTTPGSTTVLKPYLNSQGYPLVSLKASRQGLHPVVHSKWPLDAKRNALTKTRDTYWPIYEGFDATTTVHHEALENRNPSGPAIASDQELEFSNGGELQNYYVQLRSGPTRARRSPILPAAQYARRHTIELTSSTQSPSSHYSGSHFTRGSTKLSSSLPHATIVDCKNGGIHIFGGEQPWQVPEQSGKYPYYDSYMEAVGEDIRLKAKDHTIVPEFRISEHIDYYMTQKGGDFLADNTGSLSLTGSSISDSGKDDFFKVYSHSDFMKRFDIVDKHHEFAGGPTQIELKCSAYMKLTPYDGFYPAQRTVQMANLFSSSFGPSLYSIEGQGYESNEYGTAGLGNGGAEQMATSSLWATYMRPYFAPGIMYNSIKSGLAVDYPIMTSSFCVTSQYNYSSTATDIATTSGVTTLSSSGYYITEPYFHHRVPFEAIVNPEKYIINLPVTNMEPHPSGAMGLSLTGAVGSAQNTLYTMAANNFFAEVPEFFLQNSNLSAIASLPENTPGFGRVEVGSIADDYFADMDTISEVLVGASKDTAQVRKYAALVKIRKSVKNHQNFNPLSGSEATKKFASDGPDLNHKFSTSRPVPHPWTLSPETITMYDRPSAFGPPSSGLWGSNAGYNMPYTPPYYDGEAWAIMEFTPYRGSGTYTLDEIMQYTKIMYTRAGKQHVRWSSQAANGSRQLHGKHVTCNWPWTNTTKGWANGTGQGTTGDPTDTIAGYSTDSTGAGGHRHGFNNGALHMNFFDPHPQGRDLIDSNAMQISASVNLMQKARIKAAEYNALTGNPVTVSDDPQSDLSAWVIQTKFETPILNFTESVPNATFGKEQMARGMWHQYGKYPEESDVGVFLEITDVPPDFISLGLGGTPEHTGSLVDLVGFSTEPVKLGVPAPTKVISEAVVAVPFI